MPNIVSPSTGVSREYSRICAAVVWGDPTASDPETIQDAIVIAGLDMSGIVLVLREAQQSHLVTAKACIGLKDRLFIDTIWAARAPRGHIQELLSIDGLCRYHYTHRDKYGNPVWNVQTPEDVWPDFRSRDAVAAVVPIPERVLNDLPSTYAKVASASSSGIAQVDFAQCPAVQKSLRVSANMIFLLPVFRAYIFVVAMMLDIKRAQEATRPNTSQPIWNEYHLPRR